MKLAQVLTAKLRFLHHKTDPIKHVILRSLTPKNWLIVVSMLVGIIAGLAAVALKHFAHIVRQYAQHNEYSLIHVSLFLYPILGIVLTVIYFKFVQRSKQGKGLTDVIECIEHKSGVIGFDKTYTHVISGALTVGFGGSTGLEAPIAVTGSAIGSNIARFFKLGYKERTVLLASGASAGIAAIFNCPIAGVLFSIEVLLPEFSLPSIIPLLVATASASVVSKFLYSGQLFFVLTDGWRINSIPFYFIFGLILGLFSLSFTKIGLAVKEWFHLKRNEYAKAWLGGLVLGVMILLLPPLYGEGYETIELILSGKAHLIMGNGWSLYQWFSIDSSFWNIMALCVLIIIVKPLATFVTLGAGGNGGAFAPSLFMGALIGFVFCSLINYFVPIHLPVANFVAAGMAGMLSGIFHAPLTAIFLIAEITGGYILFVPLMVVSALSFFVARYFEPHTIYTHRLAKKGKLIGHDKDRIVLSNLKLSRLLDNSFSPISVDATLGDLVELIKTSSRNLFPVLDKNGHLRGIVLLDDIRHKMFQKELYATELIKDIMTPPPTVLHKGDSILSVMQKFDTYNVWHLPVVHYSKYVGFISKSAMYHQYREMLLRQSKEIDLVSL